MRVYKAAPYGVARNPEPKPELINNRPWLLMAYIPALLLLWLIWTGGESWGG